MNIKKCPFCGYENCTTVSKTIPPSHDSSYVWVSCPNCTARGPYARRDDSPSTCHEGDNKAISRWNSRS